MTTRLWVFSDLHLESEGEVDILRHAPESFDAVIVAGDVHTPGASSVAWLAERLPGVRVLYVPGNHDRWGGRLDHVTADEHDARARDLAARHGIDWLDRGSTDVGGVTVHGCTLWTDLVLGHGSLSHGNRSARKGMNDYRRIRRRASGPHHYVRPDDTLAWHRRDLAWLDGVLTEPGGVPRQRPAVVVTHHAPSPRCLADPWDPLGHCYASDLRPFIGRHRPDVWVHGHVHHAVDHREGPQGCTRVVGNGRGRGTEAADWRPGLVFEVGPYAVDCVVEALRRE